VFRCDGNGGCVYGCDGCGVYVGVAVGCDVDRCGGQCVGVGCDAAYCGGGDGFVGGVYVCFAIALIQIYYYLLIYYLFACAVKFRRKLNFGIAC
jgi:hypothetical protein